ncbi:MAG: alanine--tRNA ligase [Thermoplasmatota archaeon]
MIDSILKKECSLDFFNNKGYVRKKCKACKSYFWTLDRSADLCGDQPCVEFNFIGNTLTKKPLSLSDVRELFLSYFEKHNHSKVYYPETGNRCPVVARWRNDIYLTIASIADFQPHITSGAVPPPKNPLVISQPCIRLNDLEEVGRSGRHLTMFEMMGHHAFNKNIDEIYWKEETVSYCDDFFTNYIGIPQELINYKEHLWIGGGNAGPCIEVLSGGLEIATLVFMNMKEDKKGSLLIEGVSYTQNPLNIVDTGYGLERIAWFTQGTPTVYETTFHESIQYILTNTKKRSEMEYIYALADHSKCLAFMLGDGIVPSNVKAGYLARLIIRRSLRFIKKIQLQLSLKDLVIFQLHSLEQDFPSLKERIRQIEEILDIETKRYAETLLKGKGLVKRIINEQKKIDINELVMLYDTHGMSPDIVQNIAKKEGVDVSIPDNFDSMIAELHSQTKKDEMPQEIRADIPKTKPLYYDNHYLKDFNAKIIWKNQLEEGTEIILDQTAFYPEGGGQPSDTGILKIGHDQINVLHVKKEGDAIIHLVDKDVKLNDTVQGIINWDNRYMLMKHHTGTHAVNGALRKLYGEHIWQAGSQLAFDEARFDFSHYDSMSDKDIKNIETLANSYIKQSIDVEKKVMQRNDAEKQFGFRLYQGGVPPGEYIRVLNIPGVDVEACGGMHLNNTIEIEKIRIKKIERIQDGVNRIIFAAGEMVDKYQHQQKQLFGNLIRVLEKGYHIKDKEDISDQIKQAEQFFSVSASHLEKTIQRFLNEVKKEDITPVENIEEACIHLFNLWKKTQKEKKEISSSELEALKKQAQQIPGTQIQVITGISSSDSITVSTALTNEDNYIAHIFDGKKITSSASENIEIDLREIAPKLGSILGGSGGGKPKLTQCGGPKKENITAALDKAVELTIKKLKK